MMDYEFEINKLKKHAEKIKFEVELREGTYGVCRIKPSKKVIVPTFIR